MPYLITFINDILYHTRIHKPYIICFNLKVNIICPIIILRIAGHWRINTIKIIFSRLHIGTPKMITGFCEHFLVFYRRSLHTIFIHGHQESKLHINIILPDTTFNICWCPFNRIVIYFLQVIKFCGCPISNTNHFPGPAPGNFIFQ